LNMIWSGTAHFAPCALLPVMPQSGWAITN